MQSAADVNVLIRSDQSASERRVNPSWTITHLKTRLEPITGIPSSSQRLTLRLSDAQPSQPLEAAALAAASPSSSSTTDDSTQLSNWPLQAYAEIYVHDARPAHLRTSYTDVSLVEKYEMPHDTYDTLPDSVLAWKRSQQLGRFDPNLPSTQEQQRQRLDREIAERHIVVGARCKLLPPPAAPATNTAAAAAGVAVNAAPTPTSTATSATGQVSLQRQGHQTRSSDADRDARRGQVRFVGDVPDIPGVGKWVGVALDEPTGKHDGSVQGTRYFECARNCGVFVRPERVEVGDFAPLDDFDEDMEEI